MVLSIQPVSVFSLEVDLDRLEERDRFAMSNAGEGDLPK